MRIFIIHREDFEYEFLLFNEHHTSVGTLGVINDHILYLQITHQVASKMGSQTGDCRWSL